MKPKDWFIEQHADVTRLRRGRLFRKYFLLILGLVCGALLISGAIGLYFSYQENQRALATLQREKAVSAAARIEQFVRQIEQQLAFAALPQLGVEGLEQRRIEFLKLLRLVPAVTDIAQIDPKGREQLAVSRLAMDVAGADKDRSQDPAFKNARPGQTWFGPVYFRKETEPYMSIAVRSGGEAGPVTVAEMNLKFIWDVVTRIKIGQKGKAYVVDGTGFLVADPDIGLVLRKTNLSGLEQVKAALQPGSDDALAMLAHDFSGKRVLTAHAPIDPLGWKVFIEQPVSEVFAALDATIMRTVALIVAGLLFSALAAMWLAGSMVRPIRTLQEGAARIGAGDLEQQITVRTGDELEALADQFNRMSAQLRESYAGLERKVEERTAELQQTLGQQTAISEVLRTISDSPSDVKPVLDAVAERSTRLCDATSATIYVLEGAVLRRTAYHGPPELLGGDTLPYTPETLTGRTIAEGKPIHVPDIEQAQGSYPETWARAQKYGRHTMLSVPLLREGRPFGTMFLRRAEVRPFSDQQIALSRTFADQAAIAIENVRLFNETKEALEQQKASAEVLGAISSSIADTKPVFDKILKSCERLFAGKQVGINLVDADGKIRIGAYYGPGREELERIAPFPSGEGSGSGAAIAHRRVMHYPDVQNGEEVPETTRRGCKAIGVKAAIFAPMLWEGRGIGVIFVGRDFVGRFTEKEITLLKTFADQAAIAIQNARLFREIQEKSAQLEVANKHKSDFLANMSHIELGLKVDKRLGEFNADERKFKQILLNLLSNAVKFTQDGGRVDVSAKSFDGKIEIAVRDTGIGIAPADHAAVFEEFKQVGRDYTRKAEGTGLGLALTKRFVELHGGEIRLESAPGKGSTFTFTLPVRQ